MKKIYIFGLVTVVVLAALLQFTNLFDSNRKGNDLNAAAISGTTTVTGEKAGEFRVLTPQCSDKMDNDGDKLVDYPVDPGCVSISDNDETDNKVILKSECSDGVDNDTDTFIDTADANCHTDGDANNLASYDPNDNSEACLDKCIPQKPPQCSDKIDNDTDSLIDAADPGCHSDNDPNNSTSYVPTDNDEFNQCADKCISDKDKILLLAGYSNSLRNDVFSSTDMENWNLISPNDPQSITKWSPRFKPETVYFKGKYWVFGGDTLGIGPNQNPDMNDVWSSPDGVSWTRVGIAPYAQVPTTICTPACFPDVRAVVFGNNLYLIDGGFFFGNIPAKVWSSPDGINWTLINSNVPFSPREGFMATSFKDKMYVMGGKFWGGGPFYSDVWSSADGVNWTQVVNSTAWGQLARSKVLVLNDKMYVLGGLVPSGNGNAVNSLKAWSSPDGSNWTLTTSNLPLQNGAAFNYIDAIVANGKLWLATNASSSGTEVNSIWSSADGSTWTQSNVTLPWSPRTSFRFVSSRVETTPPPVVCAINSLTVPASTTYSSSVNMTVSWSTTNCNHVLLQVNSGSGYQPYTAPYSSVANGTYTFTTLPGTTISTADTSVDVTIMATNNGSTNIVSQTKTVPITGVSSAPANQCAFSSVSALPVTITLGQSTNLSWASPAGCIVYIQAWTQDLNNGPTGMGSAYVWNPGTYYFPATGNVTLNPTKPTSYYITSQSGSDNNTVLNAKAVDVKVQ